MKKIKSLILVLLISTFGAMAQNPNRPNFDPNKRVLKTVEELSKQITITPAIQDSLKQIFVRSFDSLRKAKESGNKPDIKKIENERDMKVKSFLTEEQFKAYQKFMEERKNRKNKPNGEGGMPERP